MKSYNLYPKPKTRRKIGLFVLAAIAIITLGVVWHLRTEYENNLKPVSVVGAPTQYFTVATGSSLNQIADNLQSTGLIRSSSAFEWYVRSNELRDNLQAGTYSFSPSMTTQAIAQKIANGDISKNLVTILPGTRLDQVQQVLVKAGYSQKEATAALQRSNYSNAVLKYVPAGRSLEGFLYPDSFQKNASTPASSIISKSLDEMNDNLTPQIIAGFKKQGLSVYRGVTLASIVEQESGQASDDPKIAQVFLSRLHSDIALGSDVTARYAAAINHEAFSPSIDSPYNTRVVKGLPPGPVGSVTTISLKAVASPAHTSYLFFVTGDDGVTYFSYTEAQHEALIQKYCIKACQ